MNNVCKICFKDIKDQSLFSLINKKNLLCEDCFSKLKAQFRRFSIMNVNGTAIYDYDEIIKELIYKFKGCYDYELKDIFLYRYLRYLRFSYRGFDIVSVPSYHIDDEKRGFNHVQAIFESLKLPKLKIISKIKPHKQSDLSSKGRKDITSVLAIDENINLKGKKILLVDDIFTTGSTLFSCIELLKKKNPKRIEMLVVAKTKFKRKT